MEKEVLATLLEMLKSGGQIAIWGIIAYWIMTILSVGVKGGILWVCMKTVSQLVTHCWDNWQDNKRSRVTLLSEQISLKLQTTLEDFQKATTQILKELYEQSKPSKEDLKK